MQINKSNSGGYRSKGKSSLVDESKPLISIITIVYNSEALIERTINNVLSQSYPNIEFIIIDGGSNDETINIVKKHEKNIAFWQSEPDKGLYDAMNKGLGKASGDYVWFINSGDLIYSENTVSEIFKNMDELPDILYGETNIVDENYQEIGKRRLKAPEQLSWRSFRNGMMVCHQSILIKRDIAEKYDIKYKRSADYDWVLKALRKTDKIKNTKQTLSKFLDGGVSKKTIPGSLKERFDIMVRNYGLMPTILQHFLIAIKFFWFWGRNRRF